MILFPDDWARYPTAIADTNTTNRSWVHSASLYKSMGLNNYDFHLALLQPALVGVNVYSHTLSEEQKAMIRYEVAFNPWYYFREVARIPNGANPLMLESNRANLSMYWCFFNGIDYCLIMVRQTGKSVSVDQLDIYLMDYYYKKTDMLKLTKDIQLRKKNVDRLKKTRMELPAWLSPATKQDADNMEMLECGVRENKIKIFVGQQQEFLAKKVARGETSPFFHSDEGPYTANIQLILPALAPATAAGRENAVKANTLYGSIYTTTAGELSTPEGLYMYNFFNSGMFWNDAVLDSADRETARKTVSLKCRSGRCMVHGTFSHRQVGKTDEWLRGRIALADSTPDEIARDYFNKWTTGSTYGAISPTLTEILTNSETDPLYTEVSKDLYCVNWYIEKHEIEYKMATGHYVLGIDSSQAAGGDDNALVLTDIRDLSIVATATVNEAYIHKFAKWVADFLIRFRNVTLIIENKISAMSIIDIISASLLEVGIDPFTRLYSVIVDDHKTHETEYRQICIPLNIREESVYLSNKKKIGFNTNQDNRKLLYNIILQDAVRSTAHLVKDKTLTNELKCLIVKNNRVDHRPGGHDDSVIAWLLCHWFLKHSKNLAHYGINPRDCLSHVNSSGAVLTNEELETKRKISALNVQIETTKEKLLSCPGLLDRVKHQKLLEYYVSMAKDLGDTTLNIDTIMRNIKQKTVSGRHTVENVTKTNLHRLGFRR